MAVMAEEGPRWQATGGIVGELNREWLHLVSDGGQHYRGDATSWHEHAPALRGCRSLADVLQLVRDDPDMPLVALLALARDGDELAGRVVLQSLIGRLVGMARRDVRASVDDYLAALWCVICTYPVERRPRHIAANLALDTLKTVHREHRWLVRGEVTTWPPGAALDELVDTAWRAEAATAFPGLVELLDEAQRSEAIDDAAREVLTSVYLEGLSCRQAALRHQMSPGSIRSRCHRAVARLRLSAQLVAEAA